MEITRRRDAAFIAGVLFMFAPYRMSHVPHLQVLAAFGMPIALLALHRYLRDPRARWLMVFALAWLWQGLANGYYLLFFSVLVGMWMLWFVPPTTAPKPFRAILAAGVLAAVPLLPILWQYRSIHEPLGFARDFGTIRHYGADALALLSTEPALWLWGWLQVYRGAEGQIFPGLTIVLLIVASVCVGRRPGSPPPALPERLALRLARRFLWTIGVVTAIAALAVRSTDPWEVRLFGTHLLSIGNPVKPLTWALTSAMLLLLTSAPVRRAWSTRSVLGFYVLAAGVMWVLCLGPAPTWMGEPLMYRGPYALLMSLPGFNSLRVPARFWMLSVLCLSVVGAMLFDRLGASFPAMRRVLAAAVVLGAIAEGWIVSFPVYAVPEVWSPYGCAPPPGPGGAVLELPMGEVVEDVGAMYRSISHRRPTINGYSGYFPPHYFALRHGVATREPRLLTRLAEYGLEYVVIDRGYGDERELRKYVSAHEGVTLVCSNDIHTVFHVPPAAKREGQSHPSVPMAVLSANINNNDVALMSDGDLRTRWQTGPQERGMMLEIDLGSPRDIAALQLSLGSFSFDFPRGLRIEASDDRSVWHDVWRGGSAGLALTGALENPASMTLQYDLHSTRARFLRLWLTEEDDEHYWTIAELRVLGP
ncbi:MAG TPA: discoidin domain-containing protein, partial [Vicinamibacterales bacterium]|nr:discoidin domain-containing protein [Vicinamibacterales bacterium]